MARENRGGVDQQRLVESLCRVAADSRTHAILHSDHEWFHVIHHDTLPSSLIPYFIKAPIIAADGGGFGKDGSGELVVIANEYGALDVVLERNEAANLRALICERICTWQASSTMR